MVNFILKRAMLNSCADNIEEPVTHQNRKELFSKFKLFSKQFEKNPFHTLILSWWSLQLFYTQRPPLFHIQY